MEDYKCEDDFTPEEQADFENFMRDSKKAAGTLTDSLKDHDPRVAFPAGVLFLSALIAKSVGDGHFKNIEEGVQHAAEGLYMASQDMMRGPKRGEAIN